MKPANDDNQRHRFVLIVNEYHQPELIESKLCEWKDAPKTTAETSQQDD